jgi:hypothetical protein
MHRDDVIKKIKKAARKQGLTFEQVELKNHTGIIVNGIRTVVSRSSKDFPNTWAETVWKQLEAALGKGWWK